MDIGLIPERDAGILGHIKHCIRLESVSEGIVFGILDRYDKECRTYYLQSAKLEDGSCIGDVALFVGELVIDSKMECFSCKKEGKEINVAEENMTEEMPQIDEETIGHDNEDDFSDFDKINLIDPEEYEKDKRSLIDAKQQNLPTSQGIDEEQLTTNEDNEKLQDSSADSGINGSPHIQYEQPIFDDGFDTEVVFVTEADPDWLGIIEFIKSTLEISVFIPGKVSRRNPLHLIAIWCTADLDDDRGMASTIFAFKYSRAIGWKLKEIFEAESPVKVFFGAEDYSDALKFRLDVKLRETFTNDPRILDLKVQTRDHIYSKQSSHRKANVCLRTLEDLILAYFGEVRQQFDGNVFPNYMADDEYKVVTSCLKQFGGNDELTVAACNYLKRKTSYLIPLMGKLLTELLKHYTQGMAAVLSSKRDKNDEELAEFENELSQDPVRGLLQNDEYIRRRGQINSKRIFRMFAEASDDEEPKICLNKELEKVVNEAIANGVTIRERHPSAESNSTFYSATSDLELSTELMNPEWGNYGATPAKPNSYVPAGSEYVIRPSQPKKKEQILKVQEPEKPREPGKQEQSYIKVRKHPRLGLMIKVPNKN